MNTPTRNQGPRQADGSVLNGIPTPEEIRQEMAKNAECNRVLRSLYRLSRRVSDRKRQAADDRQGVRNDE